jgi:hypothetical protein
MNPVFHRPIEYPKEKRAFSFHAERSCTTTATLGSSLSKLWYVVARPVSALGSIGPFYTATAPAYA